MLYLFEMQDWTYTQFGDISNLHGHMDTIVNIFLRGAI